MKNQINVNKLKTILIDDMGLTYADVAYSADVSSGYIWRVLNGKLVMKVSVLNKILSEYNIDISKITN